MVSARDGYRVGPRMRRFRKWRAVGKWLAIVLAGLVVLLLATSKIIHWAWNHERAAASITRWSSKGLSGSGPSHQAFTFGRVDYPWLPAVRSLLGGRPVPFDAWEITIWDPDGQEVLYSPHVHGGIRLGRLVWALARGVLPWQKHDVELHFVETAVDTVRCHIRPGPSGRVNLVAAFAQRVPQPPTGDGLVVEVEGSSVADGAFRMEFPGWRGELEHMEVRIDHLRYSSFPSEQQADRPAFTYHVSRIVAPAGRVTIGAWALPLDHFDSGELSAEDPARQDMVIKAVTHSLGADLAVAGRLTDVYSGHAGVDLRIEARHGRHVLALFPSKRYLGGDASATAHLTGPLANVVIEGAAHGAEAHLLGFEAERVAARYHLGGGTLRLHDLTADVAGGHSTGELTLEFRDHRWHADIHWSDLKSVPRALLPVEILAYLVGIAQRITKGNSTVDESVHLRVQSVDITLYRRASDALPHRVVLRGKM